MNKSPRPGDPLLDISDGDLIQLSLKGDHQAFERLVERYRAPLARFISRLVRDEFLAADIMQHVLLQWYLSLPTLRVDSSLKAWLFQVARNRWRDELRRRKLVFFSQLEADVGEEESSAPLELLCDPDPLPEELAEQHEIQQRVLQMIQSLPPKQRHVVWMRYAGQLSYAEIACRLALSESTARTNFARAKPVLRRLLADRAEYLMLGTPT